MPPKSRPTIPVGKGHKVAVSKAKAAPKRVLSPPEKLKRLFNSLCAQIDGGHFKNAVKTCDKILRIDPKDPDALQTKLFLLLQTDQYDIALSMLASSPVAGSHNYEKAYALYRLHREAEAAKVLSSLNESGAVRQRGAMHLNAQLNYRQGAYQAAFDIYSQLLDTSEVQSDEHADLLTNLNAAQLHLDFLTTGFLHALDVLPAATVGALETAPPPAPPTAASAALASLAAASPAAAPVLSPAAGTGQAPALKKVRMSRVPKGVVPGVTPPPDPERWLKKSERSTFGQGYGRRRKAGGGGATQGSTADATPGGQSAKASASKQKRKK